MNLLGIETAVREQLGLEPEALGSAAFHRAVGQRMRANAVATPDAYLGLLTRNPTESSALIDELVVPETWFFRGGRVLFERLAALLAGRSEFQGKPARILSVPCSTGEEPYSLVIALRERLAAPETFTVDACDISESHLARAVAARFTAFAFREPGTDIRPTYFRHDGNRWELLSHIRTAVRFRIGNATDPHFLEAEQPYDLILCRNLFIYLTADARTRAMATLDHLLAPDGWLCLSPGEAGRLSPGRFSIEGPAELGIYRRSKAGDETQRGRSGSTARFVAMRSSPTPAQSRLTEPPSSVTTIERATSQTALAPAVELNAARQLADAGKLSEARIACEHLTHGDGDLPGTYTLLGVILQAQGYTAEASEAFRKALYLDPDHAEALGHMIVMCNSRGDVTQAAILRKRLARIKPEEE